MPASTSTPSPTSAVRGCRTRRRRRRPYDEYAATDWRAFLIPATLVPPNPATAPLTAVVDSAVDVTHPDLAGITVVGDPAISDLHGTAVAAVIGGRANGFGMVGVFPGAPILSVGSGLRVSDVIKAISTAVKAKAKVINMSLGSPCPSYAMFVELAYGVSQGTLPVAAAGNDLDTVALRTARRNPVVFPAAFPHVLSVAAIGPSAQDQRLLDRQRRRRRRRAGRVDPHRGAGGARRHRRRAGRLHAPGRDELRLADRRPASRRGWSRRGRTSPAREVARHPALQRHRRGDKAARTPTRATAWSTSAGAITRADPPGDATEVNDDIEWIDGTRFSRADTPVFKAGNSRKVYGGYVDAWKDPADVYRIEVAKGRKVTVKLATNSRSDPDLAVFGAKARTIYSKKARLGVSFRGTGKTESVTVRNRGSRKQIAYIAVYAPGSQAALLDAPYVLDDQPVTSTQSRSTARLSPAGATRRAPRAARRPGRRARAPRRPSARTRPSPAARGRPA